MKHLIACVWIVGCVLTMSGTARGEEHFVAGTWNFGLSGSYIQYVGDVDGRYANLGISGGYMLFDRWELNLVGSAYRISQEGPNANGGAIELLGRTYLWEEENWAIYIDGGGGRVYTNEATPPGGTSYNWTARLGGGAAIRLCEKTYLMTGLRYFHLSNGRVHGTENNPSFNGVEGYVGVMWMF